MIVVGLYGVLLLAVFFDCARYKIPNALIVAALAVDLVLVGILNEPLAAFYSFIIGLLFILIIFPFYLLGAIGAGDIKLLFVVSIITGFYQAMKIFSVAMLIAGIIGIIKLLFIILRKKDVDREIFINKYFFINKFTKRSLVAKKVLSNF